MPIAVGVLWTVTLIVAYLAVPLLVILLWRIMRASIKIERYTRETRVASQGITTTLEALPALNKTEELLQGAHSIGGDLALGAEAMASVLANRANT